MVFILATLWALGNLWGIRRRWRRGRFERLTLWTQIGILALAVAGAGFGGRWAPFALGIEVGLGSAVFWRLSENDQGRYVLAAGVTLGAALYYWGWSVLPGGAAGAILGWAARWLSAPPTIPLDGRVRDPHLASYQCHALLCFGESCRMRGAEVLFDATQATGSWGPENGMRISTTACLGYCREAPVVWLEPRGQLLRQTKLRDILRLPQELGTKGSERVDVD